MAKGQLPEVREWLNKIKYAERVRKDADDKYGYNRGLTEYRGDFMSAMPTFLRDTPLIPINEIYSYAKTFISSVYSRNPHISFNPKGTKSIASSKLLEMGVNAYWRELRLKRQVRRCIFDAVFAEGWIKVGYTAAFGSIAAEDGEPNLETNEFIRDREIFATRVSWQHMVRDPDAVDGIHDARWLAQKIIKPLEAVKASPLYTAKDIRPTHVNEPEKRVKGMEPVKEEFIEFWELWDADQRRVYWISDGADEYLREPEKWPYGFDGYGYELLRFNDNPDEPYAPNLIAAWEPQLWEKIKIRSLQMDHIKRFNRQLWAKEGSVSKMEMEKFSLGKTGAINFYQGDAPPQPAQYPQIQTDIYAIEGRIDLDKDNISGQPNAVRSAPQRTQSRTLGEIDRLIAAFQSRQSDPQDAVEDFCGEVAYKIAGVMQSHLPADKWVRVTQQDLPVIVAAFGKDRFDGTSFRFSKKDIAGAEYETEVKAGSTLPLDRQGRMETMVSLLKLGATIGIGPGTKVAAVIGKNVLAEADMKEIELAYDEMLATMARQEFMAKAVAGARQGLLEDKIASTREAMMEDADEMR